MTEITAEFPGGKSLMDAGFKETDELSGKSREELMTIPGIGEATAEKIIEALNPPFASPREDESVFGGRGT